MSVTSNLKNMISDLQNLIPDAEKFDNLNNAAGTRGNKGMLIAKGQCAQIRKLISGLREERNK